MMVPIFVVEKVILLPDSPAAVVASCIHTTSDSRDATRSLGRSAALLASDSLGTHPACRTSVARLRDNTRQRRVVKDEQYRDQRPTGPAGCVT
jgi:gamma-glutamyl:cysteine ligase YbdK (ATP-grasp superfamily)